MDRNQALPLIDAEARRILSLLRRSETSLETSVPTCPGWTLERLADHLARVYSMVCAAVSAGGAAAGAPARESLPRRPTDTSAPDWLERRLEDLLSCLRAARPTDAAWNFVEGQGAPVAFWWRRQTHETLIHRTDAELAIIASGSPPEGLSAVSPVDPVVAADGVAEYLELNGIRLVDWHDLALGESMTLHLHASDAAEAEWTVDCDQRTYATAHLKADVALRGPAWALDRWCWGRGNLSGDGALDLSGAVDAFGDWKAAESWRPAL